MARWSTFVLLFAAAPALADPLAMTARSRVPNPADQGGYSVREQVIKWEPSQTAIVICDMWDMHWCAGATKRVGEMAPRMNQIVAEARNRGVFIVHAPSDCMDYYKDTPQRKLAQQAPEAKNQPKEIANWCRKLEGEPPLPVDDSDGGCDDVPAAKNYRAWKRQHPAIIIAENDAVSDQGKEIWNLLEARGIKNVLVMGVHTNMCVLGRPFGLRQMARNGKNVCLVRDLTDAMYNPAKAPFVSHRRGTELIIEHIERFVCPSVTAIDICSHPAPSRVVFMIGEDEYRTNVTLPKFAKEVLEKHNIRASIVLADEKGDKNNFPGVEQIKDADLVVLSAAPPRAPGGSACGDPRVPGVGKAAGRHPDREPRLQHPEQARRLANFRSRRARRRLPDALPERAEEGAGNGRDARRELDAPDPHRRGGRIHIQGFAVQEQDAGENRHAAAARPRRPGRTGKGVRGLDPHLQRRAHLLHVAGLRGGFREPLV